MKRTSNSRVLQIAIAVSIALHLLILPFVPVKEAKAAPEQPPATLRIVHIAVVPKPTPRPTPPPKLAKAHRPSPHAVAIHAVRLASHLGRPAARGPQRPPIGPVTTGFPSAPPDGIVVGTTAPAVATPTPKPACTAPDVPAKTIAPVAPEIPQLASEEGLTGTTEVEVHLSASGAVLDASVYRSSGSMLLDRAAIGAARASSYSPEQRACRNIPGSYLFSAQFDN